MNKPRETDISLEANAKLGTLRTDRLETSNNEIQSIVIVKEINVEEELKKAQKEEKNYFKALSMSFYERPKSHSVDNHETKEKLLNNQSDLNLALSKKRSSQTSAELLKNTSHKLNPKLEGLKKNTSMMREFYVLPDRFRKRFVSPDLNLTRKISLPTTPQKKFHKDDLLFKTMFDKNFPRYELSYQRLQTVKNGNSSPETEENVVLTSPYLKTLPVVRKTSPKKKTSKKLNKSKKMSSNHEEKAYAIFFNPSSSEKKANKGEEIEKKKQRNLSSEANSQGNKGTRSQNLVKGLDKASKNKSTSGSNKSMKSLPSTANSQVKMSRSESQEVKKPPHEEEAKGSLKAMDTKCNKEEGAKTFNPLQYNERYHLKTHFQEYKEENGLADKRQFSLFDLHDSDYEGEQYKSDLQVEKYAAKKAKRRPPSENDQRKNSPQGVKLAERVSTVMSSDIISWRINSMNMLKKGLALSKEKYKLKSKESISSTNMSTTKLKIKQDSIDKLNTLDNWIETESGGNKKKTNFTPKFEFRRPRDERTAKIVEAYSKPREKRDKTKQTSPKNGDFLKTYDFFNVSLVQKQKEKL